MDEDQQDEDHVTQPPVTKCGHMLMKYCIVPLLLNFIIVNVIEMIMKLVE